MSSNFTFKIYKGEQLSIAADIALKNRLYVSGWELSGILKRVRTDHRFAKKAVISFCNEVPIGIILLESNNRVVAFTRKSYRRKGVASTAIKYGNIKVKKYDMGIDGSWNFWKRVSNPEFLEVNSKFSKFNRRL